MSLTSEELQSLKLPDLKKLCKEKSLPSTGAKFDLITRLLDYEKKVLEAQSSELVDEEDLLDDLGLPTTNKSVTIEAPTVSEKLNAAPATTSRAATTITTTTKPVDSNISKVVSTNNTEAPTTITPGPVAVPESETAVCQPVATASKVALPVSADERKRLRQERFKLGEGLNGSSQPIDALKKRAERFGELTNKELIKGQEEEKRLQRAQRFGGVLPTSESSGATRLTPSSQLTDEAKKQQRAARFGTMNVGAGDQSATADEKKLKRAARFGASGNGDDAAKKQKRAERFGLIA